MSAFANVDTAAINAAGVLAFESSGFLETLKTNISSSTNTDIAWTASIMGCFNQFAKCLIKNPTVPTLKIYNRNNRRQWPDNNTGGWRIR